MRMRVLKSCFANQYDEYKMYKALAEEVSKQASYPTLF